MAGLELLPSGVDTELYRPDPAGRAEIRARYGLGDRPTVVCVSRLVPRKGQDQLIRALPRIRERVPDAVLLSVGGGPDRKTLAGLVTELGLERDGVPTRAVPGAQPPAHHAAGR